MLSRLKPLALLAPLLAVVSVAPAALADQDTMNPLDVKYPVLGGPSVFEQALDDPRHPEEAKASLRKHIDTLGWHRVELLRNTALPICFHMPSHEHPRHDALQAQSEKQVDLEMEDVTVREYLDALMEHYPDFTALERPGPLLVILPRLCVDSPECPLFRPIPKVTFEYATAYDAVSRFHELEEQVYGVPTKFTMKTPEYPAEDQLKAIHFSMVLEDAVLMDVLNRPFGEIGWVYWTHSTKGFFNWSTTQLGSASPVVAPSP